MYCERIAYYQFRNIESADLVFSPEVNVFCGDNAQGKTNALEGIYLMAQGRSFRTVREKDMIRFGQEQSAVKLWFFQDGEISTLEMRLFANGKRQCFFNGVPLRRLSEFIGHFRAVVFCPEHLSIVKDGPSVRRSFLDMALSQLSPVYLHTLQEYGKILSQRNAMLKQCREYSMQFAQIMEPWSVQLAERAEKISEQRQVYLDRLQCYLTDIFADMTSGHEVPKLRYTDRKTKEEYLSLLQNNLEREIRQQITLYGIHRDDYEIRLNDREARLFASQGQQRSIALAMKLSEGEISRDMTGQYPVFLLDDIFSELDAYRRSYITNGLKGRQVIITSCNEQQEKQNACWRVCGGKLYSDLPNKTKTM